MKAGKARILHYLDQTWNDTDQKFGMYKFQSYYIKFLYAENHESCFLSTLSVGQSSSSNKKIDEDFDNILSNVVSWAAMHLLR